jgi:prepilin-type N-terminal cleavage/methylation domain-containing protein/prepilin-type processing-associated H-X9-DG protein
LYDDNRLKQKAFNSRSDLSMEGPGMKHFRLDRKRAFTLVELLVVIGIIGVLISILMPSLTKARKQATKVACMSNLKQIFLAMQIYSTDNKAWLFPVGPDRPDGKPSTLGTNQPPHERWPVYVKAFGIKVPAGNIQYTHRDTGVVSDGATYPGGFPNEEQWLAYPAEQYTPKVMLCPEDQDPWEYHSYVVNQHLADDRIRFGSQKARLGKLGSSAEVVVAGEKKTANRDYYMEEGDFDIVVEPYRHGVKLGSNYLFLDGHVDSRMPDTVKNQLDPWDPNPETTQP